MAFSRLLSIVSLFLCILSFVFTNITDEYNNNFTSTNDLKLNSTNNESKINSSVIPEMIRRGHILEFGYRIIGGHQTHIIDHPYMAYYWGCGATIIDKFWLLTAAHCGRKPTVSVGSTNRNTGTIYRIKQHIVHNKFDPSTNLSPLDYDFQLLRLWQPLRFKPTIQSIKIGGELDFIPGHKATILGWGRTTETSGLPDMLRSTTVTMISRQSCTYVRDGPVKIQITMRMICAGEEQGQKDTCQGDSGGPLISNGRLIGITSFGIGCGHPKEPGVYSFIHSVRNWIYHYTRI